jgi:hypothetical protein
MATNISNSNFSANSNISLDWNGGYKIEVDLTSDVNAQGWTLDFDLPGTIRGAYGVDLIDNGNGNYTISGQGGYQDLEPGETAKAIFIVDDNGQEAVTPLFDSSDFTANNLIGSPITDPLPAPAPAPAQPAPAQPAPLSPNAISVGFEGHSNNTTYDYSAQSKDWSVAWSNQLDKYASISTDEAHSGSNSLKMDYPANEQSNAGAKWQIPGQQEYYLSYWLKFDENFDFDGNKYSGGKLPGLGEGDLASGGVKPNGENGFTSRYMWREGGKATVYLYHMDMASTWGDDILLKGEDGQDKYFERGKWHNMIQRVQVNDAGQNNGEMDVWMDKEQVLDLDGLKFNNGQGIDTAYFSSFHGGNGSDWWPEQEVNAYFDDFVVSTNAADVGL